MIACRLITAVALLIHSVLGCGLHHASACGMHAHDSCLTAHEVDHSDADHSDADHHDHHACHEGDDHDLTGTPQSEVIAPLCCCHYGPCEESDNSCHSELECSYKPSSGPEFLPDIGPVVFVAATDIDTQGLHRPVPRVALDAFHARSLCALHCTWQI
jgi:hypothetical protein